MVKKVLVIGPSYVLPMIKDLRILLLDEPTSKLNMQVVGMREPFLRLAFRDFLLD